MANTRTVNLRPVLVNVSSSRLIVGFATSFDVTRWIQDIGFLRTFGFYSLGLLISCLFLPLVYIYGKRIRAWTSGRLELGNPWSKEKSDSDSDWSSDVDDKKDWKIVHLGPQGPDGLPVGWRADMGQQWQSQGKGSNRISTTVGKAF